jgi:hypothetical protein
MRHFLACVVVLMGCRGRFDANREVDAAPDSVVEPPLPAMACARSVLKIATSTAGADLAVTSRATGYVVAWTDSVTGEVTGATVDLNRRMVGAPQRLLEKGATALPGLAATATRVWMVVTTGSLQNLYSMEPGLGAPALRLAEPTVAGFSPIGISAEPASASPVWVRASAADPVLRLAYLPATGPVGTDSTTATINPVTALSVADYKDHVHLGWRETSGICHIVDVKLSTRPEIPGGPTVISNDCTSMRIVSGPEPTDSVVSTWVDSAGTVRASFVGASLPSGGTYFQSKVATGRAPKVTFDGTSYWIAWMDADGLRFARVEKNGVVSAPSPVVGVTPVGDEGFELVRHGTDVDLVVLEKESMTFLTLCNTP